MYDSATSWRRGSISGASDDLIGARAEARGFNESSQFGFFGRIDNLTSCQQFYSGTAGVSINGRRFAIAQKIDSIEEPLHAGHSGNAHVGFEVLK